MRSYLIAVVALALLPPGAQAQLAIFPPAPKPRDPDKLFATTQIEPRDFHKEMPLAKFLARLEKKIPPENRWSIKLDVEAFGKEQEEVGKLPMRLLAKSPQSLAQVMRFVTHKLGSKFDFRVEAHEVLLLTTPERALLTRTYDVGDIVEKWSSLQSDPELARFAQELQVRSPFLGEIANHPNPLLADLSGGVSALVRLIVLSLEPKSWQREVAGHGSIRILNGTRLEVRTNWDRHDRLGSLLFAVRNLQDVAVVMNAQLFEVDAEFYAKQLEPAFKSAGPLPGLRSIAPIAEALEDAIVANQKMTLKGEGRKIANNSEAVFSLEETLTVRLAGEEKNNDDLAFKTFTEGIAFTARVAVPPDRRRIRLKLTQKTARVVPILKLLEENVEKLTVATVEFPTLRETTTSEYLDAFDSASFMVRVPEGPRSEDGERRRVLLIRPQIYIEAEERAIRDAPK